MASIVGLVTLWLMLASGYTLGESTQLTLHIFLQALLEYVLGAIIGSVLYYIVFIR